jgi:hypothetical protein
MDLRLVIEMSTDEDVEREWTTHLSQGGAFVAGATAERNLACTVVLVDPDGRELSLTGRTVFCDASGVGVQLDDFGAELRGRIETFLKEEPERDAAAKNVYERLRGLNLNDQMKAARDGELAERIALERLYGKTVWEALLRNPRISPPEVARIARMGQLPRPMLDLICASTAWLRTPEVRRALLGNPKVGADVVARILRMLPKHELKLVPQQTTYPSSVRDAARRILKGD